MTRSCYIWQKITAILITALLALTSIPAQAFALSTTELNSDSTAYSPASKITSSKNSSSKKSTRTSKKSSKTNKSTEVPQIKINTLRINGKRWAKTTGKQIAGSVRCKGLTGISLSLAGSISGSVKYKAYLKNKGWTRFAKDGKSIKSRYKANAIQALRISIGGKISKSYNIFYSAYLNDWGWTGWAKNGNPVGGIKLSNIKALKVRLVKKGLGAPGNTANSFFVDGQKSGKKFIIKTRKTRTELIAAVNTASGKRLRSIGAKYDFSSKAGKRLRRAIQTFKGKGLSFVMIDINSGRGISFNPNKSLYIASSIKGPYVAAISKYRPHSANKRIRAIMSRTIKVSSNEGYSSLRRYFGSSVMANMMKYGGVTSDELSSSRKYQHMSSRTLAKLWIGTYWYYYRDANSISRWARGLHAHPWYSFIDKALTIPTRTKPGWYPMKYHAYNDAGVVLVDGHPYIVAIMSAAFGHNAELYSLVRAIDGVHSDIVKNL